jgi:hypothetical protein
VVITLSWLGRGDYAAADWEEAPTTGTTPPRVTLFSGEARKTIFAAETSNDRFGFLYELPLLHRAAALVHEDQSPG